MYAVFALTLLVAVAAIPVEKDKYETKWDGVNLDDIIRNDRLFDGYIKCLMEKAKCTPDGEELKRNIPDALETNCSKCSAKQKAGAQKMMKYMFEKKPDQYKELEAKYDPQAKYRKNFATFVKA